MTSDSQSRWLGINPGIALASLAPLAAGAVKIAALSAQLGTEGVLKILGDVSASDAIRSELRTGNSVGGKYHSTKGKQFVTELSKWIAANPSATPQDVAMAQAEIDDINRALKGLP